MKGVTSKCGRQVDAHYPPCEADDAIIDVHEAEVGCWYPHVQYVDGELVARIRTHSAR